MENYKGYLFKRLRIYCDIIETDDNQSLQHHIINFYNSFINDLKGTVKAWLCNHTKNKKMAIAKQQVIQTLNFDIMAKSKKEMF